MPGDFEAREQGYTLGLFYHWHAKLYAFRVAIFGAGLLMLASLELWNLFWLEAGLLLGILSQDYGWAKSYVKNWPIDREVTDWDKMRQIAEGELTVTY